MELHTQRATESKPKDGVWSWLWASGSDGQMCKAVCIRLPWILKCIDLKWANLFNGLGHVNTAYSWDRPQVYKEIFTESLGLEPQDLDFCNYSR